MELTDSTNTIPLKKIRPKQSNSGAKNASSGEIPSISGNINLTDEHKQKNVNTPAKITRARRKKRSPQLASAQDKSEIQKSKTKDKKLKTESQIDLQNDFYPDPTLVGHIEDLHEDIIHCNEAFQPSGLSTISQKDINTPNKFYLQCTYGFKEINKSPSERSKDSSIYIKDKNKTTSVKPPLVPISVALNAQRVFLIVSTICQGLLAGLVLWHCLMVFFLRRHPFSVDDFYFHYSFMAYPCQAIIYFLHAVSLLSVLDRCDFGYSLKNFCYSFIIFNASVYLVILYTVAFILSLAIKKTEDRLVLEVSYKIKTNSTESAFKITEQEYQEWWIMTIVRTVILIINWILISVFPNRCQLTSHMKEVL